MQWRDIEPLELRIYGNAFAAVQAAIKAHRTAVHENQIDLGVRHAERFDRIFDRRRAGDRSRDGSLALLCWKVVVQFFVEAEVTRARRRRSPGAPSWYRRRPGGSAHCDRRGARPAP